MLHTLGTVLAKAGLSLLMSLATEAFFRDMIVWIATKAAESSKTTIDDELVAKIKKHLGEE